MTNKRLLSITIALGILFGSCSKSDDTGTPDSNSPVSIGYVLKVINPSTGITQKSTAGSMMVWTSGSANPTLVKFEAKQNNTEIEFKSENTAQIDLFTTVASTFGNFTLTSGNYNELELKLQLDRNGNSPALRLSGTFTGSAGADIPVIFEVNEFLELKTEVHDIVIPASGITNASTSLDLSGVTNGITEIMMQHAELAGSTLIISASSNKDLYKIMLENLEHMSHRCEIEHHH